MLCGSAADELQQLLAWFLASVTAAAAAGCGTSALSFVFTLDAAALRSAADVLSLVLQVPAAAQKGCRMQATAAVQQKPHTYSSGRALA
jgi:hypothetical protein